MAYDLESIKNWVILGAGQSLVALVITLGSVLLFSMAVAALVSPMAAAVFKPNLDLVQTAVAVVGYLAVNAFLFALFGAVYEGFLKARIGLKCASPTWAVIVTSVFVTIFVAMFGVIQLAGPVAVAGAVVGAIIVGWATAVVLYSKDALNQTAPWA